MPKKKKKSFEDCIDVINNEINKKRPRWTLKAIAWMDFDDVAQLCRIHIHKKWHLYDPSRPLAPWASMTASNHIKNLIRNHYSNFVRPCLKCAAGHSETGCDIYETQCSKCPLYANWERTKKKAYDTKLPLPMEHHLDELHSHKDHSYDIEEAVVKFHMKMEQILKPLHWKAYQLIYVDKTEEKDVIKKLKIKSSGNKQSESRQLRNIKEVIITQAKKTLYEQD
jgi:hypothetical protein